MGLKIAKILHDPDHYCIIDNDMFFCAPFEPTDKIQYLHTLAVLTDLGIFRSSGREKTAAVILSTCG